MTRFRHPDPTVSLPQLEERVLARWAAQDTFQRSVARRVGAPEFVFYDGPPFANGLPHYGHILTSYVKDTVPRYFTMRGHRVERRWGWDCHGLPVELDAQRQLGLRGVKEINDYGVGRFNEVCRASVFTYAEEWQKVITRIGRWVDFEDQYRTMDLSYMETVMWLFHELYERGLVYESYKVLAYCTSCQTPLSNFETRMDDSYRDREDPTVTVALPLVDEPRTSLLVWTTTPWTLPSNVAVAIAPDLDYATWESPDGGERVVLAAASEAAYAERLEGWRMVATDRGARWGGRGYVPIFDYFASTENAFVVVTSDVVVEGEGTGLVHIAPAFGEDDARIGRAHAIAGPMPVHDDGTFDERVSDFAGLHVFEANPLIEEHLRNAGRLFDAAPYSHPYPHCWRCSEPLIYRAIDSWMVDVDKVRGELHAANDSVHWIPTHVGVGAMRHGIENAPDWALTRNRFWGSPIPVWKCDHGDPETGDREIYVPGSIAELAETSGCAVDDLHRPAIDDVTWPCAHGGTMRRVPDVLDCWFESGAMPFAQRHWPFEQTGSLDFPADFIVEYIGQVRGWFYTLLVISSSLRGESPFRNCLTHGVLLGNDGRKLSKRLQNYPDPTEVIDTYGSDALRASQLSSAIVRGGDGAVSVENIREASRRFLAPLWNAWTFFATYAEAAAFEDPPERLADVAPAHPLDRFALAAVERLRAEVTAALDAFDLARAYDSLALFLELLTNWYIRLSRRRFWEPAPPVTGEEKEPFDTLYTVLHRTARVAAPLLPFLTDARAAELGAEDSVHLEDWPEAMTPWSDAALLAENDVVERLVTMARAVRAERKIRTRQPLARLVVAGVPAEVVERYRPVIASEVNVRDVEHRDDPGELAVTGVSPDPRVLGPRLGKKVQDVLSAARAGDAEVLPDGTARVAGETLAAGEFSLSMRPATEALGIATDRGVVVALDLSVTPELRLEGLARDLLRHVQELRKTAGLRVSDRIRLVLDGAGSLGDVVAAHGGLLQAESLAVRLEMGTTPLAHEVEVDLDGSPARISLEVVGAQEIP